MALEMPELNARQCVAVISMSGLEAPQNTLRMRPFEIVRAAEFGSLVDVYIPVLRRRHKWLSQKHL